MKVGVAYTLGNSQDNASDKRNILWNTYSDTNYWGPSSFDRRHVASIYYIYDLPFWRDGGSVMKSALGGWQISGATFLRSGTPFSITRTDDIAGVGEGSNGQPVDVVGDIYANSNGKFSGGVVNGVATDQNFVFNPTAFASPKAGTVRQRDAQPDPESRGSAVGHRVLQELRAGGEEQSAVPHGDLQLPESPEPQWSRK